MPDIHAVGQFSGGSDVNAYTDAAEFDVWTWGQFSGGSDINAYRPLGWFATPEEEEPPAGAYASGLLTMGVG